MASRRLPKQAVSRTRPPYPAAPGRLVDADGGGGHDGGERIEVRVESLAPGGDAVGRQAGGSADGRVIFVALAAPGERVSARVVRRKARVAWAELIAIEEPSVERVTPPCAVFGRCGGCQWQHVSLPAQRAAKRAIVARALSLAPADIPMIAPVEDGQGYRDRARLVVGSGGQVGFHARRSQEVVAAERCLLLSPALQRALDAIRGCAAAFFPGTEIDLQAGREGVHVALRLPPSAGGARQTAASCFDEWRDAGVVGVRVFMGGKEPVGEAGAADVDLAGSIPGEEPLRAPAGAFAQVGDAANRALIAVVMHETGDDPGAVLELYAGSGNFTRALLKRARQVRACDGDREAVKRGRQNAARAIWSEHPPNPVDADVVVVDPPREGLDAENLRAVLEARRRIVYVSCDPQTLGRDARRLAQGGFALRGAVALDLMPHTYHVEVVATFERP